MCVVRNTQKKKREKEKKGVRRVPGSSAIGESDGEAWESRGGVYFVHSLFRRVDCKGGMLGFGKDLTDWPSLDLRKVDLWKAYYVIRRDDVKYYSA